MSAPLLQVKDLKVYYHVDAGAVKAVDGVSFDSGSRYQDGVGG